MLDIIKNSSEALKAWLEVLPTFAVLIGLFLVVSSLFYLARSGPGSGKSPGKGLAGLIIGLLLISYPSFISMVGNTAFGSGSALELLESSKKVNINSDGPFANVDAAYIGFCVMIVAGVGAFATIKGLLMLKEASTTENSTFTVIGALTFIVGGVLCINIYQVIRLFENTTGFKLGIF